MMFPTLKKIRWNEKGDAAKRFERHSRSTVILRGKSVDFLLMSEIKAGLLDWKWTQVRGLWRCPVRLSYALAAESGMCSGTGSVFSTGLWWISVHLDNRVVRSLGWHSTSAGQKLAHADDKVYSSLFSAAEAASLCSEMLIFRTSVQQDEGDQLQCSRRLLYFSICWWWFMCRERQEALERWDPGVWRWAIGGLGNGQGGKSALLVFDPGQHYTRGHRTTAAVPSGGGPTSACIMLNHTRRAQNWPPV